MYRMDCVALCLPKHADSKCSLANASQNWAFQPAAIHLRYHRQTRPKRSIRDLAERLDAAVAEAYALPPTASDDAILTHLCALNAQRAAEERTGQIRHLRPAFQNPTSTATQTTLATGETETAPLAAKSTAKLPWPNSLAEQAQAVRAALVTLGVAAEAAAVAGTFKGARVDRVADILDTLASLGQARVLSGSRFVAP